MYFLCEVGGYSTNREWEADSPKKEGKKPPVSLYSNASEGDTHSCEILCQDTIFFYFLSFFLAQPSNSFTSSYRTTATMDNHVAAGTPVADPLRETSRQC